MKTAEAFSHRVAEGDLIDAPVVLTRPGHHRIALAPGARASFVTLIDGAEPFTLEVTLGASSRFESNCFALGRGSVRCSVNVRFEGEGAECDLNGLYVGDGTQRLDLSTEVDHAVPGCASRQRYKGILDGHARATFVGAIKVRTDAQRSDASQSNPNLLLGRDATAETRPQLEILADDVRCTHGATVGRLSDEALFFLRARGIAFDEARAMLVQAFATEIVDRVPDPGLRSTLERAVGERLRHAL